MFLNEPPASAGAERMYADDMASDGYVWNLTRLWAWRPDVQEAFTAARAALSSGTTLTARDQAVLVTATARALGDSYCALAWGARLATEVGEEAAAAVLRGEPADALTARDRALADWAGRAVEAPGETTPDDVARLRGAGLDDREIVDATLVVAFRIAFGTVNDALGAAPDAALAAATPAPVRDAVRFGRPPGLSAAARDGLD